MDKQKKEELIKKHISEKPKLVKGLSSLDIKGIANYIKNGNAKKILILTGAGISVYSGIPDFRSDNTGIYNNIQKYNLSKPELIFTRFYFNINPKPFFDIMKMFLEKEYKPSPAHYLPVLFNKKGILLKYYTQNVDNLDKKAGLNEDYLIEFHGTIKYSTCRKCNKKYLTEEIKNDILNNLIPKCTICNGIIQPDIVLYDDDLPEKMFEELDYNFQNCDLLIVMGTSLKVEPFPGMIEDPKDNVPRILINNEIVGSYEEELEERNGKLIEISKERLSKKFKFGHFFNTRDVFIGGDLQNNVIELVKELGWEDEFNNLIDNNNK